MLRRDRGAGFSWATLRLNRGAAAAPERPTDTVQGTRLQHINGSDRDGSDRPGEPPRFSFSQHVEKKSVCAHCQLKSASSSEVAAMIEGGLRHCTQMSVDRNDVDTHGQSEVAFAFSHLLGFRLLPRLKNLMSQRLYRLKKAEPGRWQTCNPSCRGPFSTSARGCDVLSSPVLHRRFWPLMHAVLAAARVVLTPIASVVPTVGVTPKSPVTALVGAVLIVHEQPDVSVSEGAS